MLPQAELVPDRNFTQRLFALTQQVGREMTQASLITRLIRTAEEWARGRYRVFQRSDTR